MIHFNQTVDRFEADTVGSPGSGWSSEWGGDQPEVVEDESFCGRQSLMVSITHTHTLTHSLTESLACSLTQSLTHSITHSLNYSITHSITHSLTSSQTQAQSLFCSMTTG